MLTPSDAKNLLLTHSYLIDSPRAATGFLGSLRPYTGLSEANFREVMSALIVLTPELHKDEIDREVVSALWGICYFARNWGIETDGMLRRNNLISDDEVSTLTTWVNTIEECVMYILQGDTIQKSTNYDIRDFSCDLGTRPH